jgi:hypothetical protein
MKYTLKIEDSSRITQFLKKFSVIESNLLLGFTPTEFRAASHTPEKSVVKEVSAELSDVFSEIPTDMPAMLKLGIFQIDKLAQAFKFFGDSEFSFIINAEEVNDEIIGTSVILQNASLTIEFTASPMTLFTYIDIPMFANISDRSSAITEFKLGKEQQSKINSLFGIDSDYSKITFLVADGELRAKGKNFNYLLDDNIDKSLSHETSIFKHHYIFIDREDSTVFMNDDKLVIVSDETQTTIVVGQAE